MAAEVEVNIVSDPRWLRLMRGVIREFTEQLGFDTRDGQAITVAVGEAVSNVIRHAYKGDASQRVSLACRACDGWVEIEVRDEGEPFDPANVAIPPPEEMRAGGRGVYLIQSIMDEVVYLREGKTNLIRMKKFFQPHPR